MFAASPQPQPSIPTKSTDDVIKNVELATFMADVIEASNQSIIVVDFWAPWCGPCKAMGPAFAQAAHILEPNMRLLKVDTEQEQALAGAHGIRSIPTLVLFAGGREVRRVSGAMDAGRIMEWARG